MAWWTRPLIRLLAAGALPLVVPALITAVLWALPGDPAAIICPPEICDGTDALARRWNLDRGPWAFYLQWMSNALQGAFGNSWRVQAGVPVAELLASSLATTTTLLLAAFAPVAVGTAATAAGLLPRRLDVLWQSVGLVPAVIFALAAAASVELNYGALSYEGWPATVRLLLGAVVLGAADGTFASAVVGTRTTFESERARRYVRMAVLRGEAILPNVLPNVLPAWVGQLRGRALHVMSGTVVVEVVMGIPGLGELLFLGTLRQDFGVVLAATWAFSLLSASLLALQALMEVAVAGWVRRSPVPLSMGSSP